MNRPMYETEQDRANEQFLAKFIEQKYGMRLTKMSIKYHLDFIGERDNRAVAFFEMRRRKNAMMAYPDYMISLDKVRNAKSLADVTGMKCFLVVMFSDCIAFTKLPPSQMRVAMGGSTRRNDAQDFEPMAYINMEQFTILEKANAK